MCSRVGWNRSIGPRVVANFYSGCFQVRTSKKVNWSERMAEKFKIPNIFYQDVPNPPPDYFTCAFKANKLSK